jgi:hypothetical protein
MAGLNYTIVVWFLGPATLGAGQSVEYTFTYPGGHVVSFNSLDTSTALNQKFSYETTGIVTQGRVKTLRPTIRFSSSQLQTKATVRANFSLYCRPSTHDERLSHKLIPWPVLLEAKW